LLRVRGLQDAGWDPFVETHQLVDDLMTLIGAPLIGHTKARLGLLLYSHLTEVGSMYEMLANSQADVARFAVGWELILDLAVEQVPVEAEGAAHVGGADDRKRVLEHDSIVNAARPAW
jgi:hypothetical protein